MKALVFLLALSGCYLDATWTDVPGATVTAKADRAEDQEAWELTVAVAVDEWAAALEPLGCRRPFYVGDDGHDVRLYHVEDAADEDGLQWGRGFDGPGEIIEVWLQEPTKKGILLHELGHAFGLDHEDGRGAPSIMTNTNWEALQPRDVASAACVLGCGPCL